MVRKMLAEMQPFRIRLYASIARNCSKIDILLFTEQPLRSYASIARNCSKIDILLFTEQPLRFLAQQALASGSQAPPAPAAPHITPLPEGFALDPPAPSQLYQPASARGQAPKRPAPETSASTASEGPSSGLISPAHPSQPSAWDINRPLTAFSGPSHRTPVGAHPYQRPAGCFYPESARQAGDTEKCLQGSRTVKFLCQVAPRREVPYARGPEPRPGCEKLRGCFCMATTGFIHPRWLAGCLNQQP